MKKLQRSFFNEALQNCELQQVKGGLGLEIKKSEDAEYIQIDYIYDYGFGKVLLYCDRRRKIGV